MSTIFSSNTKNIHMSQFLLDNILLIGVIIVSAGYLFYSSFSKLRSGPSLNTGDATQLINRKDAQIVDLRDADEFKKGHLPNARNLSAKEIQNLYDKLSKSLPVLLVDQKEGIAPSVARLLRGVGFSEVYVLEGGIEAWKKAELPLKK